MRSIPTRDLIPGDVLVGDAGGRAKITGDIEPSNLVMGCIAVETEHGTLYLDPDEEQVVDRPVNHPDQPTVIVRRRFGVWLEDAVQAPYPSDLELAEHDGDLQAWAFAAFDDLYVAAIDKTNTHHGRAAVGGLPPGRPRLPRTRNHRGGERMRYQIVTLRVPFDPEVGEDPPYRWHWHGLIDANADAAVQVLDADPVSDDPNVQPVEHLPEIVTRDEDLRDRLAELVEHHGPESDGTTSGWWRDQIRDLLA